MRRTRLYYQGELTLGEKITLNPDASRYLLQVLRKKVDDIVFMFNHTGFEFSCKINEIHKKNIIVQVNQKLNPNTESHLSIHLGQAISRGERMDYVIQKAVELGVFEITPLFSEFCQVKLKEERMDKRIAHWQAIAISAAEQSGRTMVPKIHLPNSFKHWIEKISDLKLICHTEENNKFSQMNPPQHPHTILLAIGPEGGFSDSEMQCAVRQNFMSMSLGPRILRTETAPVVALSFLQEKWGDLST